MIKKFDKDGDGKLSETERAAAFEDFMKNHPEIYKRILEKFDKDNDGKLSEDERGEAKKSHHKRHGKGDKDGEAKKSKDKIVEVK